MERLITLKLTSTKMLSNSALCCFVVQLTIGKSQIIVLFDCANSRNIFIVISRESLAMKRRGSETGGDKSAAPKKGMHYC
jgi:hypothetical protein